MLKLCKLGFSSCCLHSPGYSSEAIAGGWMLYLLRRTPIRAMWAMLRKKKQMETWMEASFSRKSVYLYSSYVYRSTRMTYPYSGARVRDFSWSAS